MFVCKSNKDGSPNDVDCRNPFTVPHTKVTTSGVLHNFKLSTPIDVPANFHIGVCFDGTVAGGAWPPVMLNDNGARQTGRSWIPIYDNATRTWKWKKLQSPSMGRYQNLLIRVIMDAPTSQSSSIPY